MSSEVVYMQRNMKKNVLHIHANLYHWCEDVSKSFWSESITIKQQQLTLVKKQHKGL
jgi:hypothetical protein